MVAVHNVSDTALIAACGIGLVAAARAGPAAVLRPADGGSVWAPHSEFARVRSTLPSDRVVIRLMAMALRTAASDAPHRFVDTIAF